MSQYGMQMPAGQAQRGPMMNIYTGLLFAAVLALIAACAYVFVQGKLIGPGGDPFSRHKFDTTKGAYDINLGAE